MLAAVSHAPPAGWEAGSTGRRSGAEGSPGGRHVAVSQAWGEPAALSPDESG